MTLTTGHDELRIVTIITKFPFVIEQWYNVGNTQVPEQVL